MNPSCPKHESVPCRKYISHLYVAGYALGFLRLENTPRVSRNENLMGSLFSSTTNTLQVYLPDIMALMRACLLTSLLPYLKQVFPRDVVLPKALAGVELQLSDYSFEVLRIVGARVAYR